MFKKVKDWPRNLKDFLNRLRLKISAAALAVLTALGLITMVGADDASLSWVAPTENTDGTILTDLAGFKIYRATVAGGPYTLVVDLADPLATTYLDTNLPDGLYCYVATAYDAELNESDYSNEVCKLIDSISPNAPSNLTVQ